VATSGSKSVAVTSWNTLKFTWELQSQSVANNTSTISWKLELIADSSGRIDSSAKKNYSITVNGTKYTGTNSVGIAANSTITLKSGSTTIAHNSNGTKTFSYSFSQEFSITFSGTEIGTKSGSGSGTLPTIARKSSISASNGTLGTAQTLTVSRQDSSFKHTITYKCGSVTDTIATKSSNASILWTPPLTLAKQNTTGTSVSVVFTIETFADDTSIGTNTKTITCAIPASVKPTVSLSVSDSLGYASTYGGYIQGMSKFNVAITASGSYGSTIKAYKTTADGKTYTAANFTTSAISGKGTLTIAVTVTDSRGRTATTSTTVTVLTYAAPKITALTVFRCDANGNSSSSGAYLAVRFSSSITPLNSKNSAEYVLKYKKTTESTYTSKTLTDYTGQHAVSNGLFVFAAETASSYNITLTATDAFGSVGKTATGSSIKKLLSVLSGGLGLALGKIAELSGVFDIAFKTRHTGGLLHPFLEANTDLNDIVIPNTYISQASGISGYSNCPVTSGTFSLYVEEAGSEGQIRQKITTCSKTISRTFERYYYQSSWGSWICTSDMGGKVLWSGSTWMKASQTASLSEAISKQPQGIVLVFSAYADGTAKDINFHSFFVHKNLVANQPGKGHSFILASSKFTSMATKYLYISDAEIKGNDDNELTGTLPSGITYSNNAYVLRYVIGV
jgi:hypothetical protein